MFFYDQFSQTFNFDYLACIIVAQVIFCIAMLAALAFLVISFALSNLPLKFRLISAVISVAFIFSNNWIILLLFTTYNIYALSQLPINQ